MNTALSCVLALLSVASLSSAAETCTGFINKNVCSRNKISVAPDQAKSCSALYEGFHEIQPKIRQYINTHILQSYQYTLLSSHFGNHIANRPGFEALYSKLSDDAWNDAIELIKYNAKRGGQLTDAGDFATTTLTGFVKAQQEHAITEYNSLAAALDMHKELASGAHDVHKEAIRLGKAYHDPEISSFIENEFVHKHSATIRSLAGHLADMNSIMSDYQEHGGSSLSLYMFDEYLQKSLGVAAA